MAKKPFLFTLHQISLVPLCLWLLLVSSACSPTATTTTASPPASAISTSCPAAGTGRAAIMPSLQLGSHQTIVSLADTSVPTVQDLHPPRILERYDVSTKTTGKIAEGRIRTAQLSHDGQWLLLSVMEGTVSQIQLVRLDGRYRQTLYCAPHGQFINPTETTGMQWSPDQTHLLFTQGVGVAQGSDHDRWSILLLDLSSGKVQGELSPTGNQQEFLPITWRDTTRVTLLGQTPFEQSGMNLLYTRLYLFDIRKGPNQHITDLQLLSKAPTDPHTAACPRLAQ